MNLIPGIEYRFATYAAYGNTPFHSAFTEDELKDVLHLDCKMMQSVILENIEGKEFKIHELPNEAQFAPVFGSLLDDFNGDNKLDIMLVGNSKEPDRMAGYYDASFGDILINNGDFTWTPLGPSQSKFIADGDQRAMAKINVNGSPIYLTSENDGYLKAFTVAKRAASSFSQRGDDWYYLRCVIRSLRI